MNGNTHNLANHYFIFTRETRALLGLSFFIGAEVMFFGGLICVFLILKASSPAWPPAGQPYLPVAVTAINSIFLLASAATVHKSHAALPDTISQARNFLALTIALGAIFLGIQGYEWVRLVRFGLTLQSSTYGGTFYTLIGCHAMHVAGGLIALLVTLRELRHRQKNHLRLAGTYWLFVVALWPVLFILVYF